jgi:hypothetical protein
VPKLSKFNHFFITKTLRKKTGLVWSGFLGWGEGGTRRKLRNDFYFFSSVSFSSFFFSSLMASHGIPLFLIGGLVPTCHSFYVYFSFRGYITGHHITQFFFYMMRQAFRSGAAVVSRGSHHLVVMRLGQV